MNSLKKEDISQEVLDLYDDYAHNKMDRRQFVEKLSAYAVGSITVGALLSFITPNYKDTLTIPQDHPGLESKYIEYPSPKGGSTIKGCFLPPRKFRVNL